MWLECEKPFLPGEHCVTSPKKAAKETRSVGVVNINPCRVGALVIACTCLSPMWLKVKALYLTSVVPSVTRLVSMEVDGVPITPPPLPLSVLRFTAI